MSQIPTQTSKSSINWQSSKRDPYSRMKDTEARNRKDIQRLLSNDRCVIKNARSTESKQHGFYQLDKQEQERRMKGAALRRVKQRINDGHYTSCIYPDFAGYVPKVVSGEHGYLRDPEKEVRMVRQLAALRREQVGGQLDSDDDDDEDPLPIKAEETTTKQKMSESLQFVQGH
jgi:aspartate oxidase